MRAPPPSLSTRLGGVRSSPVRDILELTQRAEVISFAGGLPAPFNRPDGGMFVWARLRARRDAERLLRTALEHDVAFVPGFPFFACEPDARTLRLSFTTPLPEEIAEGLARLRRATAA